MATRRLNEVVILCDGETDTIVAVRVGATISETLGGKNRRILSEWAVAYDALTPQQQAPLDTIRDFVVNRLNTDEPLT